jgi:protein pelota
LIVSSFIPKQGICSVLTESSDDLWTLRRLISPGDTVVMRSSRVSKREGEYARPDRGERVKVTIALEVEKVSLDMSVDRLRLSGRIVEASDEDVSKAGSHSLILSPGQELTLKKERWTQTDTLILDSSKKSERRFLLVALDRREAGIGLLSGSHLSIVATTDSGASGKGGKEVDIQPYFGNVVGVLKAAWREGDTIVVAGPGNTKLTLDNAIRRDAVMGKSSVLIEGFDLSGSDGVRAMVKSEAFRKVAHDSALVEVQEAVEEAVRRISLGGKRVAYALPRVMEAARAGAVDRCMVSDDVFSHGADEDDVVALLNLVEQKGGKVYLCDSSLETGKQVSSLGGVVALLRYDLKG